jgi:hypothetical protein
MRLLGKCTFISFLFSLSVFAEETAVKLNERALVLARTAFPSLSADEAAKAAGELSQLAFKIHKSGYAVAKRRELTQEAAEKMAALITFDEAALSELLTDSKKCVNREESMRKGDDGYNEEYYFCEILRSTVQVQLKVLGPDLPREIQKTIARSDELIKTNSEKTAMSPQEKTYVSVLEPLLMLRAKEEKSRH